MSLLTQIIALMGAQMKSPMYWFWYGPLQIACGHGQSSEFAAPGARPLTVGLQGDRLTGDGGWCRVAEAACATPTRAGNMKVRHFSETPY